MGLEVFNYECEEQISLFDWYKPEFKIDKPIRLIELFGGIGSQAMALRNIGANFEHYRLVEFDKNPVISYNAIHGTDFEPMDITKIHAEDLGITETDKYCYIMTYSFPCQDLSIAGKMRGMEKGSGTRSGLLWEVERLLKESEELPQVLVMENVQQVHSEGKNLESFLDWLKFLEYKGYTNSWMDLNARDYGTPQNRVRTICVSILGEYKKYKFPKPIKLPHLADYYLEEVVDERYKIGGERLKLLVDNAVKNGTIQTDRQTDRQLIDLYTEDPKTYDVACCICSEARDVSTRRRESNGVIRYSNG